MPKKESKLTTFNAEFAAKQLGLAAKLADLLGGIMPTLEETILKEVKEAIERLQIKILRIPIDAAKQTPQALSRLIWEEVDGIKKKQTRETVEGLLNRVGIKRPAIKQEGE